MSPSSLHSRLPVYSQLNLAPPLSCAAPLSDPILHATESRRNVFIGLSFVVALVTYLHFAFTVIWAITNHLGVACFTVRKKDENGEWVDAQTVDAHKAEDKKSS